MSAIHTISVGGINYNIKATHYATCATVSNTATKIATIQNGAFDLEAGVKVSVKFSQANTASNPTLNINSTGNGAIYSQGERLSSYGWKDNQVVDFVYDGSSWHIVGLSDSMAWNNF